MQAIGMNGMEYLTTKDPMHAMTMGIVFRQAQEERERLDRNLAIHIANAVGKLFK